MKKEDDMELDDPVAWVKKSRQLEKEKLKKNAEKIAKRLDEFDQEIELSDSILSQPFYFSKDLQNIKVTHGSSDIAEGEYILTLKDQSILNEKYEENDEDQLENIHLAEKKRLEEIKRLKEKKKTYDVYSDDKQDILPQYDEKKEEVAFTIGDLQRLHSRSVGTAHRSTAALLKKKARIEHDISGPSASAVDDFLSPAESFKQPKKKQRKLRTRGEEEDADEVATGSALAELLKTQAQETAPQSNASDHGSRTARTLKASGSSEAEEKAKPKKVSVIPKRSFVGEIEDQEVALKIGETYRGNALAELEEEEDQLYESLAKTRKKLVPKVQAESIRERVVAKKEKDDTTKEAATSDLVFSETTEFLRLLRSDEVKSSASTARVKREAPEAEAKEARPIDAPQQDVNMEEKKKEEEEEEDASGDESSGSDDDSDDDSEMDEAEGEEEDSSVFDDQPLISRGIAATLNFMKQAHIAEEPMYIGRKGDKSGEHLRPSDQDRIRIEYRDEFGRVITPKEAFRAMSHRFHGKPPGKNKQEKRLRRYLEDQRKNQMSATDTPLNTLDALKRTQKKNKSAFVVIDGMSRGLTPSQQPSAKGFETGSRTSVPAARKKEEAPSSLNTSGGFTVIPTPSASLSSSASSSSAASSSTSEQTTALPKVKLEFAGAKRKRANLQESLDE
jgi:U4/U6.U5 tri-snRNP-associated protein 1